METFQRTKCNCFCIPNEEVVHGVNFVSHKALGYDLVSFGCSLLYLFNRCLFFLVFLPLLEEIESLRLFFIFLILIFHYLNVWLLSVIINIWNQND